MPICVVFTTFTDTLNRNQYGSDPECFGRGAIADETNGFFDELVDAVTIVLGFFEGHKRFKRRRGMILLLFAIGHICLRFRNWSNDLI